jgi:hypothetical protein
LRSAGGGTVYSIRIEILKVCPLMFKVTRPGATGESSETAGAPRRALTLSLAEMTALRRVLEARKQVVMDTIDRADELKLSNLLDDLDCDKTTSDAIQVPSFLPGIVPMCFESVLISLYRGTLGDGAGLRRPSG